jgi:hypothetical protein
MADQINLQLTSQNGGWSTTGCNRPLTHYYYCEEQDSSLYSRRSSDRLKKYELESRPKFCMGKEKIHHSTAQLSCKLAHRTSGQRFSCAFYIDISTSYVIIGWDKMINDFDS